MNTKTKTTAAAAIAALALPTFAVAHDGEKQRGHDKERSEQRSDNRSERGDDQRKSHARKSHAKSRAFVVRGVDVASLPVADGELTGALTLDPVSANKHARKFLELTKTELRGEDTVTFGESGDDVVVKFVGLQSTDALQPTDVVKVIGKVRRSGDERKAKASADGQDDRTLNIRKIMVIRPSEKTETESKTDGEKPDAAKRGDRD